MASRKITFKDLAEALKKNGFEQLYGQYIRFDFDSKVIAGCAYGQAGVNLGVSPQELNNLVDEYCYNRQSSEFSIDIINLNDEKHVEVSEIGEKVEAWAIKEDILNEILGELQIVEYKTN